MNIELSRFQWYPRLSEETNAFNAVIVVDGVACIDVSNSGKGAGNEYHSTGIDASSLARFNEAYAKLEAHANALPPLKTEYGELDYDIDLLIDGLVEKQIEAKEVERIRSKYAKEWERTLFFRDANGQLLVSGGLRPSRSQMRPVHFEQIKAQNPGLTMIEGASFEEAWPSIHAALCHKPKEQEPDFSQSEEEVEHSKAGKRKGR